MEYKLKCLYMATQKATGVIVTVYLTTSGRWCNYNTPTISYTQEELDIIKELG